MDMALSVAAVSALVCLYQLGSRSDGPALLIPLGREAIELERAGFVVIVPVKADIVAYRLTSAGMRLAQEVH